MIGIFKQTAADAIIDGGMFAAGLSQKMTAAEGALGNKFNSFVDRTVINKANAARKALDNTKAGPLEQARVAAGHVLGRAAGGALIGAGVNGYEYSQTGTGFGGAFSMGESIVSGAAAGAIVGGVVGGLGARGAARRVTANATKAQNRYNKAMDTVRRRGLMPFGSGKDLEEGAVTKLNDGADMSNRTVTYTHGINGPSSNRLGFMGGNNMDGPTGALGVGGTTVPLLPGSGGNAMKIPVNIPHAQPNMNTVVNKTAKAGR